VYVFVFVCVCVCVCVCASVCVSCVFFTHHQVYSLSANYVWSAKLLVVWKDLRADTMQMKEHYPYQPGIKEAAGNTLI
jgi:hypothetical protein